MIAKQETGGEQDVIAFAGRTRVALYAQDAGGVALDIPATLRDLFVEMGRVYVPVMLANAKAVMQGVKKVETEVDGLPWAQEPFPYQAKCVQRIGEEYSKLDGAARQAVSSVIAGTGCERLLAPAA
jgi:hypothetical protein